MPAKPSRLDYSPQGGRQYESIERSLRSVGDTRITNGRLVEVALTGVSQDIQHGLGKAWSGWFFVDKSAATDAFSAASSDDTKYLRLTSTVATNAKVWIF